MHVRPRNFKNIGHWISVRGQQFSSMKPMYENRIKFGKLKPLNECQNHCMALNKL